MKKKGFTLIELLAVIVILAIIALIATPLVLKYIETSRINSKKVSTQNYINAVDNALVTYSITNKGKKYSEGCYEISTLNTELDITMKGDIPSEGKVCIENNKIEKAIVKYSDNKIIKYEDDKSTVSDEETYESFAAYIIDEDLDFVYDETQECYTTTLEITKDIADKFANAMDYDLIIDDNIKETIHSFYHPAVGFNLYNYITNTSFEIYITIENEKLALKTMRELTGIHNIKIGNPKPVNERMFYKIDKNGSISITSFDFVLGEAKLVINDEDGIEYYNNTIELTDKRVGGIIGADWGCRSNLPQLPDVYTALTNGKTITIEVTQMVDGKEIVSTISKNIDAMVYISEYYLSSGHVLASLSNPGC